MTDSSVTSGTYTINIVPTYTLTVTGGTGGGAYAANTPVNVNATRRRASSLLAGRATRVS